MNEICNIDFWIGLAYGVIFGLIAMHFYMRSKKKRKED